MTASTDTLEATTLPLPAGDKAVFASFFTLLTPADVHRTDAHTPRDSVDGAAHREVCEAGVTRATATAVVGNTDYSALFALLSARADVVVVVLQSYEIVLLQVCPLRQQLIERRRMRPRPYHTQREPHHRAERGAASTVTTASLLPLDLACVCRVDVDTSGDVDTTSEEAGAEGDDGGETGGHGGTRAGDAARATDAAAVPPVLCGGYTYLRGVVGCSDGIVSVFSERGYAFSFFAHDAPVWRAEGVYCSAPVPDVDDAVDVDAGRHDGDAGGAVAESTHTLRNAMRHLGLVTESIDGQLYLWRRVRDTVRPRRVAEAGLFARHVAFAVYQPPSADWLFSHARDRQQQRPPQSPSSPSLLHPPPPPQQQQHQQQQQQQQQATDRSDEGGDAGGKRGAHTDKRQQQLLLRSSLLLHSTSTLQHSVVLRVLDNHDVPTALTQPLEQTYVLPGSRLTYTTALATTQHTCLVARDKQLYAVEYATGRSTHVMTAQNTITSIVIDAQLALACCGDAGRVYVLQLCPLSVLGVHCMTRSTRLRSCTLCTRALTMLLVSHTGDVHVVKLPESYLADAHTPNNSPTTMHKTVQMSASNNSANTPAMPATEILRTRRTWEDSDYTVADAVPLGDYNEPVVALREHMQHQQLVAIAEQTQYAH